MNHTKSKLSKLIVPLIAFVLTIGYCIVIFPKITKTEQGITNRNVNSDIKGNSVIANDAELVKAIFKEVDKENRISDIADYVHLSNQLEEGDHINVYLFLLTNNLKKHGENEDKGEYFIVLWNFKEKRVVGAVSEFEDVNIYSFKHTKWDVAVLQNDAKHSLVPKHSFLLSKVVSIHSSVPDKFVFGIVNDSLKRLVYLPQLTDLVKDESKSEYSKAVSLYREWSFIDSPGAQYASINISTNITVWGSSRLGVQNYLTSDKTYSTIESSSSRYKTYGYGLREESTVVNKWNGYKTDVDSHWNYQDNKYLRVTNKASEEVLEKALTYVEANPIDGILKRLSLTREQVDLSLGVFIQQLKTGVSLLVLPVKRTIVKGNIRYKYYDIHYAYIDQKQGTVLQHLIDKDAFPLKDRSRFSLAKFGLVYNSDMPRDSDQFHFKVRYTFYANDEVGPFDMIVYEDVVTLNEKNILKKNVAHLVVATDVFTKVEDDNFTAIKKRLENQKKETNTKETIYTYKIEESEVDDDGYILSTIKKSQVEEKGTSK